MNILKTMLEHGYYSVHDGFDTWEEAVRASVQPLVDCGAVKPAYADSIVNCVKKFGPYIVIAPNIALPHAEDKGNVNETPICYMKSNRPVSFSDDPEQDARLFFVLASNDEQKHLTNLKALMKLLMQEDVVQQLLDAQTVEEFRSIAAGAPETAPDAD